VSIESTLPNGYRPLQVVGGMQLHQQRRMLLADHPGAGKTLQAMLALELDGLFERPSAILITAPKTACQLTWAPEIALRISSQYAVVLADLTGALGKRGRRGGPLKTAPSVAERNDYLAAKIAEAAQLELPLIVLVNFDGLRWPPTGPPKMTNLWSIFYDAMIVDESHLVLPTRVDDIAKMSQFWRGLTQVPFTANPILCSMTGTPDRGLLHNRYGHWKFLNRPQFRSYDGWLESNFVRWYDERSGKWQTGPPKNEALWVAYERQHMLRRTKAEMLKGLPEKLWAGDDGAIVLPMTALQEAQLEEFGATLAEKAAEAEAEDKSTDGIRLQAYIRGRQLAVCTWDMYENRKWKPRRAGLEGSNVLGWIAEWLESRGHHPDNADPTLGKVVITSYFTEVLHWLADELEELGFGRVPIMEGDTPLHEKQRIEQEFQRGDLRVILLSGWLGVSINLDAADDMIFTDLVHDPDRVEQAEDRIHRASRNHQVMYWRLVTEGTIAEEVVATVDSRYKATRKVYDGSRGIAYLRTVVGDSLDGLEVAA
jgi:hypothetical protein